MGLGYITLGIFAVHFHFMNGLSHIQWFPYWVSLPILILGLIYAYRYSKKNTYLYFLLATIIMLLMRVVDIYRVDYIMRNLFLTYQTLLSFLLVIYISKRNKEYRKTKSIYIWASVYLVFGLLRSWSVFGWQIGSEYNEWFVLLSCVPIIFIGYHFLRIKVLLTLDSRPQPTPKHIPSYIYMLAIIISSIMLVVIHNPTMQYIKDGSVLQIPRIEFLSQKTTITNIQILDQSGQILVNEDRFNLKRYYSDLRTVYYKTPAVKQSVMGKSPYQLKITYYNQSYTLESRVYPLTTYENHMS